LDELTHKYKTWYQFVLETYRKRFEELIQVVENIAFKNMDERLEFYLQEKSKNYHTKSIEITHQEIAHDLNSSREVISRLLKKMENMGMVKLERSHIQLLK
jgi:CRP/FNR family transcriptional regulator